MAGFDINAFSKELQALERGGFRQVRTFAFDLSANGTLANQYDIEVPMECNSITLLPRMLFDGPNGKQELASDTTVRVWIKLNERDAAPIPVSLIANSADLTIISATIRRLFITCIAPKANAKLYFLAQLGVTLGSQASVGGSNGGGGYIPPSGGNQGP